MSHRVATFNCENLFARYRFNENLHPTEAGFTINDIAFDLLEEEAKRITAKAIKEVDADVVAAQEVESLPVLDRFCSRFLARLGYRHKVLIDSFDPRQIDVAVMSRYPIVSVSSHRHERSANSTAPLFSRDCLVVDADIGGKLLTLYANHFKSMIGGREQTKSRRMAQVKRVAEIVEERWADSGYEGNFIVLGDFNDYVDEQTSLGALVQHPGLVNVIDRLPESERWTHFYAGGDEYRQLDYLLLSKSLAQANQGLPGVMRRGLPHRAVSEEHYFEPFEEVGEDRPKASDHAPTYMDIDLI